MKKKSLVLLLPQTHKRPNLLLRSVNWNGAQGKNLSVLCLICRLLFTPSHLTFLPFNMSPVCSPPVLMVLISLHTTCSLCSHVSTQLSLLLSNVLFDLWFPASSD